MYVYAYVSVSNSPCQMLKGKTAAFAIPILSILGDATSTKQKGTRALVLAPTRELAEQIFREISRLSTGRRVQIRLLKKSNAVEKQVRSSVLSVVIRCTRYVIVIIIRAKVPSVTAMSSWPRLCVYCLCCEAVPLICPE